MTIRTVTVTLLLALAACEPDRAASDQSAQEARGCRPPPSDLPAAIQPPAGSCLIDQVQGDGVQIYACVAGAWSLRAPEADLTRYDRFVGNHYLGPTWQWRDGSKIHASKVAAIPAPDANAIPWLLLQVGTRSARGHLSGVTHVQRVQTQGGVSPPEGCAPDGSEVRVPYSAEYLFYGPSGS